MVPTLLLDTLRDADLEQYYLSFSSNGITQLESLAQLSMQDYSSLGITSIPDRRKLFQLVQKLRQELPTLENGLVSSPITTGLSSSSAASSPSTTPVITTPTPTSATTPTLTANAITSTNNNNSSSNNNNNTIAASPSIQSTGLKTPQSYRRRPPDASSLLMTKGGSSSGVSGIPDPSSISRRNTPQATASSNLAAPQTRTRSRTLPDQNQKPDLKTPSPSMIKTSVPSQLSPPHQSMFMSNNNNNIVNNNFDDYESSDEEEKCEIRRGSGPLLDPYGVPIHNKRSAATGGQRSNAFGITAATSGGSYGSSPASSPGLLSNNFGSGSGNGGGGPGQSDLNQKIRVCVRKRPLNKKELDRGEKDISPTAGIRSININEPKTKVDLTKYIEQHSFTYDDVFDYDAANDQVYQRTAQPLVKYIFDGGKATCFAYGQTGSGKTFTMLDPRYGLYVLAARDIFHMLRQPEYQHLTAWIGFYEIYQGQLYDLLNNRKKLFAREDGKKNVVIVGLKEYIIKNVDDLMQVFEYGSQARSTGSTGANSDSSRSHAILQILLKPAKSRKKIIGKLSFIDLAGSERGADRGDADTKTRMEGAEINKSLLALKECIRALDQDKRHTPFRQSKLTQVLKDSFVGNSRTCMIATISPNQSNSEHTLNTLRYADRVKELKGERDRRVVNNDHNQGGIGIGGGDASLNLRNINDDLAEYTNNEEEYQEDYADHDYNESDDPELYNENDEDGLFLDEEDFPSDGDVNILDEDFPHENHNRYFQDPIAHRRQQQQQQNYTTQLRTKPLAGDTQQQKRNRSNNNNPLSSIPRTGTSGRGSIGGGDESLVLGSSPEQGIYDSSPEFARSRHGSGPLRQQQQHQGTSMNRSHSTASSATNDFSMQPMKQASPPHSYHQHHYQQQQQQTSTVIDDDDDFTFDQHTIEDFIKYHRGEIREVAECSKKETKLLANFSLSITSFKEMQEGGHGGQQQRTSDDDIKMSGEFIDYLDRLDEVLEMKIGSIEALRDRIRNVLGEEDI
ncbi:P-loop containing nucleoside triphosphate hydrolase protein [Circinella umbellata]|nr:P-loop containing nucleoside triphosphate hydrolase protein [Circinella umbellata]